MKKMLRSTLGCALVLCAASLAACADSPTGGLADTSSDPVAAAANRNAGGGARVFRVARDEQKSATVDPRAIRPGGSQLIQPYQPLSPTPCTAVAQSAYVGGAGAAYVAPSPYPTDPCTEDPCAYNPDCTDPFPPSPVYATYTYGSDATDVSSIVSNGLILKTLTLSSFSQGIQNVATTKLTASFRNVGGQTSCSSVAGQFDSSASSGSGSPLYLSASRQPQWQGVIKWQVNGTHTFTPVTGAGGGGTFTSSDFTCG